MLGVVFITLFCKFTNFKKRYAILSVLAVFGVSTLFTFISIFSAVHSLIITAILYLFCFIQKPVNKIRFILAPIIYELSLIIVNSLFLTLISTAFNTPLPELLTVSSTARITLIIVCKTFSSVILFIILKFVSFSSKFSLANLVIYIFSPIFTVFILYTFLRISISYSLTDYTSYIVICILGIAVTNILTILLFEISNRNSEAKLKLELIEKQLENERNNYRIMLSTNERLQTIRHDIKNHLLYVKKIINDSETGSLDAYIDKINSELQESGKIITTGNHIIDYVVSEKIRENEGVMFVCTGDFSTLNFIDNLDLAIILGNLCDNAVEAVKNESEKTIEITLTIFNSYCNLHISNYISGSVIEKNPELKTTKKNKDDHGLGLRSVRNLVDKYGGLFDFYENNGKFTVHLAIPVEE